MVSIEISDMSVCVHQNNSTGLVIGQFPYVRILTISLRTISACGRLFYLTLTFFWRLYEAKSLVGTTGMTTTRVK